MDTSKEYIKMCEKAEEIQKLFIKDVEWDNDFYVWGGTKNQVWLPRQDQLQEMIVKAYGNCSWYKLLEPFINWYQTAEYSVSSMEQLWLAFVMEEKYHKIWNGEDWINV